MKTRRISTVLLLMVMMLATLFTMMASPGEKGGNHALAAPLEGEMGATAAQLQSPDIAGPFMGEPVYPTVFNGDLRDLPQVPSTEPAIPIPLRYLPNQEPKGSAPQLAGWSDSVAQTEMGIGQMPDPIITFAGLDFNVFGAGWPPDTNGDVGPNHYIQTVNTSIGRLDPPATIITGATRLSFTIPWPIAGSSPILPGLTVVQARFMNVLPFPRLPIRYPVAGIFMNFGLTQAFSTGILVTTPNWASGLMAGI